MPDATYEDFCALAGEIVMGSHPILPKPDWSQDAAMIAFFVDRLRAEIIRLRRRDVLAASLIELLRYGLISEGHYRGSADYEPYRQWKNAEVQMSDIRDGGVSDS